MDRQETKRRPVSRKTSGSAARNRSRSRSAVASAQFEAERSSARSSRRTQVKTKRADSVREARRRQVRVSRERAKKTERVIKAPREDIPQVVYTMPQPFRKGQFLLKLVSVVACVLAVVLCLSLFFRVDTVTVSGTNKYTPWMVYEASGIEEGDSLLGIRRARVAGKIIASLPYVGKVKVGINLPGTVNIEVKELDMTYAIQAVDNTWWLIAADGRVIEQIETSASAGYTRIIGVQADAPRIGQQACAAEQIIQSETGDGTQESGLSIPTQIQVTAAQRLQAALTIAQTLEKNGVIGQMASLDVSSLTDLSMEYGQRIHIVLGDDSNLVYKVTYAARALEKLELYQTGELDVSMEFSDEALFTPES